MNTSQISRAATFLVLVSGVGTGFARAQCEEQKLLAPGIVSHDLFGYSVAVDGDVAVIGAPSFWNGLAGPGTGWGQACVYQHDGRAWVLRQTLGSGAHRDKFGQSVAIDGEVIVVGARYGAGATADTGAVHVYRHDQARGRWLVEQTLCAADGQAGDAFGFSVAVSGDLIAVGTPQNDDNFRDSGSVYFFHRENGTWVPRGNWHVSDPAVDDWFGYSVALYGTTAAAGAPIKNNSRGAVYSVAWNQGPYWISHGKLSGANDYDGFGESVALWGNHLAVGAPDYDIPQPPPFPPITNAGAVYLYRLRIMPPFTFGLVQKIEGGSGSDWFGTSVAMDGGDLAVGAPGAAPTGVPCGTAQVFRLAGNAWAREGTVYPSTGASADSFGRAVSLSGDVLLVGAPSDDDAGFEAGTAWTFRDAAWHSYGSGWPGSNGVPGLTASADPVLGATISLQVGNSSGAPTPGLLVVGFGPATIPTSFGGTILVQGAIYLTLPIPTGGAVQALGIPAVSATTGVSVYVQVLELDAGASAGVSFSRGLELVLGQY